MTRCSTPSPWSAATARSRDKLVARYGGVLDQLGFSTVVESEADAEGLRAIIRTVQAA